MPTSYNLALIQKRHSPRQTPWTDRFAWFFRSLRDDLGFDVRIIDGFQPVHSKTTALFLYGWEEAHSDSAMVIIKSCPKKTKIICYVHDVHQIKVKSSHSSISLFEASDVILTPYYALFVNHWSQFKEKTVFFPHFFAPHKRYANLPFNKKPTMKCLLSGQHSARYPIRNRVKHCVINGLMPHKDIHILRHPRFKAKQFSTCSCGSDGDSYAKYLNKYFCCVTDSSKYNFVLAKYFEIPAAGSLLLADEVSDLKRLGFIPSKHYVAVTPSNILLQIRHCLKHPEIYQRIRKTGMDFVRANYSVDNRIQQLKDILEK